MKLEIELDDELVAAGSEWLEVDEEDFPSWCASVVAQDLWNAIAHREDLRRYEEERRREFEWRSQFYLGHNRFKWDGEVVGALQLVILRTLEDLGELPTYDLTTHINQRLGNTLRNQEDIFGCLLRLERRGLVRKRRVNRRSLWTAFARS